MENRYTFLDFIREILEPCYKEYANMSYEPANSVITFECKSHLRNLSTEFTQDFLQAILCKSIYESLFLNNSSAVSNHRSRFVKGQKNDGKHSGSTAELLKNAVERFEPLCNEQLHRVRSLLETTALIQSIPLEAQKFAKIEDLKKKIPPNLFFDNLESLKRTLKDNINKSQIRNSLSRSAITIENVDEALTKAILLCTFVNDYVNYKEICEERITQKISDHFNLEDAHNDESEDISQNKEKRIQESAILDERYAAERRANYLKICSNGRDHLAKKQYEFALNDFMLYQKEAAKLYDLTRNEEISADVIEAIRHTICTLLHFHKEESAIKSYKKLLEHKASKFDSVSEFNEFYNKVLHDARKSTRHYVFQGSDCGEAEYSIYQGEFKDENGRWTFHGHGIFYHYNGEIYIGAYRDGKREGEGMYFFSDSVYCGQWKNDTFDGQAMWVYKDHTIKHTQYSEGKEIE